MKDLFAQKVATVVSFADMGVRTHVTPEQLGQINDARRALASAVTALADVYSSLPEIRNGNTVLTVEQAISNDLTRVQAAALEVSKIKLPEEQPSP